MDYQCYNHIIELPEDEQVLLRNAHEATKDAYAPYSNFLVGAAALLENGEIIKGSNIENASFPLCLCAERTALAAVHAVYPRTKVIKMAVTAQSSHKKIVEPISPCGACRQVIKEIENRFQTAIKIILQGETGAIYTFNSMNDLLPMSFNSDYL